MKLSERDLRLIHWSFIPDSVMIQSLVNLLGVSEVDLRDISYYFNKDMVQVRLWNHRKFTVAGIDLFRETLRHTPATNRKAS